MKPLEEILKPFLDSEDTCDKVKEYFENGGKPNGPYINLAKYFMDDGYSHSLVDESYKAWLKKLIDEGKESESTVLKALKTKYKTKECLENFIFSLNKMHPKLNQKWHFFISYWGYREFITLNPELKTNITPLKNGNRAKNGNPFKKCEEGKLWYEAQKAKQKSI